MSNPHQPAIPWWTVELGAREKQLVCEVIDDNFPNDGDRTSALERAIAEICDVPYAVGVTSGTMAIFLALAACGIGQGDEVLVPDITFIATANAVRLTGAVPVLVDVRTEDFNIDPGSCAARLSTRTRAVIPVHVSGRSAITPELMDLARDNGLRVIEDAAEALGSIYAGKPLGSHGDAGCFSFSANKTVTAGQGGMVVTSDLDLYHRLVELKDQGRPVRGTGGADEHVSLGYNFKLTNLQAAVALAQVERFPERREHQRRLYLGYQERLVGLPNVRLPEFDIEAGETPQWVDIYATDRDGLHDFLLENGIDTRKFWYPIHTQAPYADAATDFSNSNDVSAHALWLPSAVSMTDDQVSTVCRHIRTWSSTLPLAT